MEIIRYTRIVLKRWPIALACLLATTAVTALLALQQDPTYESQSSYVIRPRTVDSSQGLRAMDTLVRGVEINSTYATVARSDRIKERAKARLDEGTSTSGLSVNAEVVTGTNVLDVVVSGSDPDLVHQMAVAVGEETMAYVSDLQDVYELALLDGPQPPGGPVPAKLPLRIGMGVVFGLGLGAMLALLAEAVIQALRAERVAGAERSERFEDHPQADSPPHYGSKIARLRPLRDARSPGAFQEQLVRALRAGRPFSVAVLKATQADAGSRPLPDQTLQSLDALVQDVMPALRVDDAFSYLGDGTYALMLPDTGVEDAEDLLRAWKAGIIVAAARRGTNGSKPRVTTRVLRYGGFDHGDGDAATAARLEIG